MTLIQIIVPGEPVGKGRPRHTRQGHTYTPAKTRDYERDIRAIVAQAYPNFTPLECALKVVVLAYMSIPKSASGKKRVAMLAQEVWPTKKPDADNLFKTLDALNGLIWRDDSQIVSAVVHKVYSDRPRLEVNITPKGQD